MQDSQTNGIPRNLKSKQQLTQTWNSLRLLLDTRIIYFSATKFSSIFHTIWRTVQIPSFLSKYWSFWPIWTVVLCHQHLTIRSKQSQYPVTTKRNSSLAGERLDTHERWGTCRKWSLTMVNWKYGTKFKNLTLSVHCILVAPQGGIRMQMPGWVLHRQSVK